MQTSEERDTGRVVAEIVLTLVSLAGTMWLVWMQIPPAERQITVLSMASAAHRWLGRAARRLGYQGMSDELAGKDPAERYGLALAFGRARDWIEKQAAQ